MAKRSCKKKTRKFGTIKKSDLEAMEHALTYAAPNNVLRKRFRSNKKSLTKMDKMPPYTEEQSKRYCLALFAQDTVPYPELERYVLKLYKCMVVKGIRKFTDDERKLLEISEEVFKVLIKNFSHIGLRISLMNSLDAIFDALMILLKNFKH